MKKLTLIVLLICSLASHAETQIPVKLTVGQIIEVCSAMSQLDGYDHVVKIEGQDKTIHEPYKFTGRMRWIIAVDLSKLREEEESYEKARTSLILQLSGGKNYLDTKDQKIAAQFQTQIFTILQQTEEIPGFNKIPRDGLNLDENPIPPSVLSALVPIIE